MGLPSKKRKRQEEEEEKKAKIKRGKFDGMSRKKRRLLMTMEDTQDTQAQTDRGIKRLKVCRSSFIFVVVVVVVVASTSMFCFVCYSNPHRKT